MRSCLATFRYRLFFAACCMAILFAASACVNRDEVGAPYPVTQAAPSSPPVIPGYVPPVSPQAEPLPAPAPAPAQSNLGLGGKIDVALLLPLSGPNAALGSDMQDAAMLAVGDMHEGNLAITPKDTKGTPDGAAEAAREAIGEGARLIIGPLTAAEAEAVAPVATGAQVNVVAFSNVARIAGNGLFVLGFLPQQEIQRVAGYAHSTGINHFAVLAPSDAYGQLAADAFQKAVMQLNDTMDPPEFYQADLSDLADVVKHVSANGNFTFAAILVPSGGTPLKLVTAQLSGAGVTLPKARLLGTGLWDNPGLISEPNLAGGWYAAPPKESRARFERHFAGTYGCAPQRLSSLAYDAVAMSAVLARTNGGDFSQNALTNPSGFAGVDGLFRLRGDGTNERGLAVLEIGQSGAAIVSPAPESFQSVGQ